MRRLSFPKGRTALILIAALFILMASGCRKESHAAPEAPGPKADESAEAVEPPQANEASDNFRNPADSHVGSEPEPDNAWGIDSPENHNMDSGLFSQLHAALSQAESINAMVTVKDGYLIDEYYKEDYDENSVFRLNSCSKSFTGALIGIAIDRGLIGATDAKLSEFLPQLEDSGSDYQKQITLEHLLTHTSGIEWYEWGGNSSSWRPFQEAEDWVDYILGLRMAAEPGSYFAYSTGGSHLLAAALQQAAGKSAYEFGQEHMFEPMGMDSVEWSADPQGITDGGNGIAMTARDAAKFGQLYLDGGRWRGQQIIPESWVELSTMTQNAGPGGHSGAYGYQWWLRSFGEENYEACYAMGYAGQFIIIVPELQLVTVITGRSAADTYAPWAYFTDYILASYRGQ